MWSTRHTVTADTQHCCSHAATFMVVVHYLPWTHYMADHHNCCRHGTMFTVVAHYLPWTHYMADHHNCCRHGTTFMVVARYLPWTHYKQLQPRDNVHNLKSISDLQQMCRWLGMVSKFLVKTVYPKSTKNLLFLFFVFIQYMNVFCFCQ